MEKIKNLVTVKHGSHLYGLARPDSDIDLYTIYDFLNKNWRPRRQVKQHIENETDQVKISLDKYIEQLKKGVPQAVEVLFARPEHWLDHDANWQEIAGSLEQHLVITDVLETYKRTVMNFFLEDNFKKNRHGFRLLLNADELKRTNQFNPTLSQYQIDIVNELAEKGWKERQEKYKDMLWKVFQ
jgi:predicted nucleotidyltransferase